LHIFYALLARGVAILDDHTRLARLETDYVVLLLLLAALGTAACRHHVYFSSLLLHHLLPFSNNAILKYLCTSEVGVVSVAYNMNISACGVLYPLEVYYGDNE
jgi:hypothetical protein